MAKLLSKPNFQQRKIKSKRLYDRRQAKSTLLDWEDGGHQCRLNLKGKGVIYLQRNQNLQKGGLKNTAIRLRKVPRVKTTWANSKKTSGRVVGNCRYCKNEVISDDSFVVFATKERAHYRCYVKDSEKESSKNIYL